MSLREKMKKLITNPSQGYTLVEILVVIAIITVLASISVPIGMRMINKGKAVEAKSQMMEIVLANQAYYRDYGTTPVGAYSKDTAYWSNNGDNSSIFRALSGEHEVLNNRRKKYLKMKETENYVGGLQRFDNGEIWGLFDPWGGAYVLCYDRDFTGEFEFEEWAGDLSGSSKIVSHGDVLVLTTAGEEEHSSESDQYSWK